MVSIQRLILVLATAFGAVQAAAQPTGQGAVYTTWEGMEADKCASIWLIRRFVAPGAAIRFVPAGTPIASGVPFDTPDALLRRYPSRSTFETLLRHHGLEDTTLQRMGRIIHDIEINVWERKAMPESAEVEGAVRAMTVDIAQEELVRRCDGYFDALYGRLRDAGP